MTFQKIKGVFIKHKLLAIAGILIVMGGGYYSYRILAGGNAAVTYALGAVEKNSLIVSVSGSGQIDVSDQIDLKPEASGKVTYVSAIKGQEVKKSVLLVSLDSHDAERAVSDAEISLESARIELEKLIDGADAQTLLQATNALAQAERNLEKAQQYYDNIGSDAESTLEAAYENGYSDVSTSFFKLSSYMKDLQDVLGNESFEQKNVGAYELILGANSPFIKKLLDDFYHAQDLYNKNFTFFREVFRDDDRDTIYKLISDTLETTKAISQALESARHMYDAIATGGYVQYSFSSIIDKMQPKVESDLSSVFSTISSLEQTIDTIDTTVGDTPGKVRDSEISLASAKENLESKKLALEELKAGADQLDIRIQQNIVAQKETALLDAKEKLVGYFIRAPFDGVIAAVNVKKGDSVSSATVLATLLAKQYVAKLTLNEIDIAKVKLNQPVTLTFDAVDGLTVTGKVTDIASVASTNQGVVTYGTTITLDTMGESIKQGMTVAAAIVTEMKPDVLLVPNSAVKSQGGISYVEVAEGDDQNLSLGASASGAVLKNSPRRQPVEIGAANDEFTEVVSGLHEGDVIITRTIQPSSTQTAQTQQSSSVRIPGLSTGGGEQMRMR